MCTINIAGVSRANAQNSPDQEPQNYLNHVLAMDTTSTTSGLPVIHERRETDLHIKPAGSNLSVEESTWINPMLKVLAENL